MEESENYSLPVVKAQQEVRYNLYKKWEEFQPLTVFTKEALTLTPFQWQQSNFKNSVFLCPCDNEDQKKKESEFPTSTIQKAKKRKEKKTDTFNTIQKKDFG